jgi:hypothetical protein
VAAPAGDDLAVDPPLAASAGRELLAACLLVLFVLLGLLLARASMGEPRTMIHGPPPRSRLIGPR